MSTNNAMRQGAKEATLQATATAVRRESATPMAGAAGLRLSQESATLESLGFVLGSDVEGLRFYTDSEQVRWNYGAAGEDTPPLASGVSEKFGTPEKLRTLEFVSSVGDDVLWVEPLGTAE
jgi:hypothetical protein